MFGTEQKLSYVLAELDCFRTPTLTALAPAVPLALALLANFLPARRVNDSLQPRELSLQRSQEATRVPERLSLTRAFHTFKCPRHEQYSQYYGLRNKTAFLIQIRYETQEEISQQTHYCCFSLEINIKIQDGGLAQARGSRITAIRQKIDP